MSLFDTPPTETPVEVKFDDLVGEGKKYKDPDIAAKAIIEKDRFIAQLQSEAAEMRKTMQAADKTQQILDQLEALKNKPVAEPQPAPQVEDRIVEVKGLTEKDVEQMLAAREQRRQAEANVNFVKTKLIEAHGPGYPQVLKSLAENMGVSADYLENMAASAPQALLRLVEPAKSQVAFTPPNTQTPGSFNPTGGGPQKRSYYKKIMETDRNRYFSPAVQNAMYRDAMTLKEEFQDIAD